nr:hypothetical protein [Saccharothrix espanaensis]
MGGHTGEPFDQPQHDVQPRGDAAADRLAVVGHACVDHRRVPGGEVRLRGVVRGRVADTGDLCGGQHHDAGADADRQDRRGGQPAQEVLVREDLPHAGPVVAVVTAARHHDDACVTERPDVLDVEPGAART